MRRSKVESDRLFHKMSLVSGGHLQPFLMIPGRRPGVNEGRPGLIAQGTFQIVVSQRVSTRCSSLEDSGLVR